MKGTIALIIDRKDRLWFLPFENDFVPFRLGRINGRLHAFSTGKQYRYRLGTQKMSVIPYVIEDVESVKPIRHLRFWLLDCIRLTRQEREFVSKLTALKERIEGGSLHEFLANREPERIVTLFREYDVPLVRVSEDLWRVNRAIDRSEQRSPPRRYKPRHRAMRGIPFFYGIGVSLNVLFGMIRSAIGMATIGTLGTLILSHFTFF